MTNGSESGHHHKVSAALLLITLGIIYGDIGTSPLYVFKEIIGKSVIDEQLVYGGISCIFWTLLMQTTVKYVMLTLRADNNGEGGILALYALVRKRRKWLVIPAVIGASTLLADGLITPPISVSSAIEGLPLLHKNYAWFPEEINTVPIVCVLLVILFVFQRFGTKIVGAAFGPVMTVWFSMLAVLGINQIKDNPQILMAFSPHYGYDLLVNHPSGFWILSAVFLCTTGAEALYSDLGHCGKDNIRITWVYVKICLVLNYMGQGALLLKHTGEKIVSEERVVKPFQLLDMLAHKGTEGLSVYNDSANHLQYAFTREVVLVNPFYDMMPQWFLPIGIVIATFATIIASQALITGSFTLIAEAMRLNLWLKHKVNYTSDTLGQIYVPVLNSLLAIGCIAVTLYFRESSNMGAAYGLSICLTMLMTSILICVYMWDKGWPLWTVMGYAAMHGTIEISFLIANLSKFKDGGYVTLIIAGFIAIVMTVMYRGRQIRNHYLEFIKVVDYLPAIKRLSHDKSIPKHASHLVYLTKANSCTDVEKKIIYSIFENQPKRADVYWLLHVDSCDSPYTKEYKVNVLAENDLIRVDIKLGFRVEQQIHLMFKTILREMIERGEIKFDSPYGHVLHPKGKRTEQVILGDVDVNESDQVLHTETRVIDPLLGDHKFIVIEKILSADNALSTFDRIIVDLYTMLKSLSISDVKSFNLEKSSVALEQVPMTVTNLNKRFSLKRTV